VCRRALVKWSTWPHVVHLWRVHQRPAAVVYWSTIFQLQLAVSTKRQRTLQVHQSQWISIAFKVNSSLMNWHEINYWCYAYKQIIALSDGHLSWVLQSRSMTPPQTRCQQIFDGEANPSRFLLSNSRRTACGDVSIPVRRSSGVTSGGCWTSLWIAVCSEFQRMRDARRGESEPGSGYRMDYKNRMRDEDGQYLSEILNSAKSITWR
jgi:hypothetical protein